MDGEVIPRGKHGHFAPGNRAAANSWQNRSDVQALREQMLDFVSRNHTRLDEWLDAAALKDPAQAFSLWLAACEYALPKLARVELTGADGKELVISWPLPKSPLDQ